MLVSIEEEGSLLFINDGETLGEIEGYFGRGVLWDIGGKNDGSDEVIADGCSERPAEIIEVSMLELGFLGTVGFDDILIIDGEEVWVWPEKTCIDVFSVRFVCNVATPAAFLFSSNRYE